MIKRRYITGYGMSKECRKCKQDKDLNEFYRNCNTRDGRLATCKVCMGYGKKSQTPGVRKVEECPQCYKMFGTRTNKTFCSYRCDSDFHYEAKAIQRFHDKINEERSGLGLAPMGDLEFEHLLAAV